MLTFPLLSSTLPLISFPSFLPFSFLPSIFPSFLSFLSTYFLASLQLLLLLLFIYLFYFRHLRVLTYLVKPSLLPTFLVYFLYSFLPSFLLSLVSSFFPSFLLSYLPFFLPSLIFPSSFPHSFVELKVSKQCVTMALNLTLKICKSGVERQDGRGSGDGGDEGKGCVFPTTHSSCLQAG